MYMAPITRPKPAPASPALRRALGLPVLLLAAFIALPWLALNALFASVLLAGRFGLQALDYAGQVALGR